MMEVEENEKLESNQINNSNNDLLDLVPTNNTNSYIKIIKELNYDTFPKYESFNFKNDNYLKNSNEVVKEDIGIIIDNGSYECRAGWSICNEPNICCRNILAKPKINDGNYSPFIVGNSIFEYEQGKINKKSPFEKNIIAHFSTQEHIFDHIFSNLNITDNNINHPILITEPICNLSFSRKCMTELMFELYGVPSLTYGIDMLFSYYYNNYDKVKNNYGLGNCLIISSSNQVSHIVPVIQNKIDIKSTRRISIGSENAKDLLMKSLHLKYPEIKQKLTNEVIQDIYHHYTMAALDYEQQLKLIEILHKDEQEKYHKLDLVNVYGTLDMYQKVLDSYKEEKSYIKNNIKKKDFSYLKSYTNLVNYIDEKENNYEKCVLNKLYFFKKPFMGVLPYITQEELKAKQEAKNEQIKRLREIMKKKREENYKNMKIELEQLEKMIAIKDVDKFKFEEILTNTGYENAEEIQQRINKLNAKLNNDIHHLEQTQPEDIEARWYLLSMPDEDLTEEQIKMKRIQKMQKNAYYSRLEKREIARREKEKIENLKKDNKEKYLVSLYRNKKEILERLAKYEELKRDMVNRHSKTNMKRMQTLAELGKDSNEGGSGGSSTKGEEDDFGKNDEDWEIYREVNKNNINEEEEEDMNRLHDVENQIAEIDKMYYSNVQQYQYNFYQENDYFILGVEQFRCAELLFKPYIIGIEQAGIIEIISQLFKNMSNETQLNLAKNIFVTGGNTYYPLLKERIYHDLRSYLPVGTEINVMRAENPILDVWKGARLFYNNTYNNDIKIRNSIYITRKEYDENGIDYFKEHFCGNIKINN